MNSKLVVLFVILMFAIHPNAFGQKKRSQTNNEVVAKDFGFKISRPNGQWSIRRIQPDSSSLMIKISKKNAGGKIEVTVIAAPKSSPNESAVQRRNASFEKTAGKSQFSNRSEKAFILDAKSAPGFSIDWKVQGDIYRVHQCYVANQDFIYTVAVHSPRDQFDSLAAQLAEIRSSFRFVGLSDEARREATLNRLVARCGSEIDWAKSWEAASEKARRENKSILVHIRSQTGFDIADGFTTVALMDQDVIEFLNERCVGFRYEKGMSAPIASYEKYGIGPASFGNTVLLADPDGTVFGDTFTYEPTTFFDFLLTNLTEIAADDQPPSDMSDPMQVADWFARRGDFKRSMSSLTGLESVEAHQKRASIFRRQRNAAEALRELQLACGKTKDEGVQAELRIDETIVGLLANKTTPQQAREVFNELLDRRPNLQRAAEVMYLIGMCQFAESNKSAAEKTWTKLIESFDENNRWTWQAAAALKSTAFRMGVAPEFGWPNENVIRAFRSIPFERLRVTQIEKAEADAIDYLLTNQQDDGSWISPPNALKAKGYSTNPFAIAITSICAKALLDYRSDPEIAQRIDRALGFLVKSNQDAKQLPNRPFYMDYSPWADAYLLRFLARYVAIEPEIKQQASTLADDAIHALANKQKPGGGWSYYITHNLAQANRPSNQSISFMTAAITIALLESREAGFDVPEKLTDAAIDCLDRMRNKNQTFTYFLWHERESEGRLAGEEGAAGRGPLCSLALSMAGRSSQQEVGACLDLFLKYRHLYSRERGKSLMHAAPGGQGSHYLMFDYNWAAAAAASLPEDRKKFYRNRLLELILSSRSEQGSYLDNPINGWHYGTGMALEAINLLR